MKNDDPIRIPTRLNIDEDKSANQWKQLLTDKRQGILDEREIQAEKKEKSKDSGKNVKEAKSAVAPPPVSTPVVPRPSFHAAYAIFSSFSFLRVCSL